MSPEHWEILELLRSFYAEFQLSPATRPLIKYTALKLGPDKRQQPAPEPTVQRHPCQTRRETGGPAQTDELLMTDYPALTLETPAEHPFAQFVRILGKGKRGARDLTREEARAAMGMVLDDQVEDTQLGAFLMLLRHKEESAQEMAGFAEALRERLQAPALAVDLDWPTYAGKNVTCRGTCWPPSAWGRTVCGCSCTVAARTAGRLYSEQLLDELNIPCAAAGGRSAQRWTTAVWPSCRWWVGRRNCNAWSTCTAPSACARRLLSTGAHSQPVGRPLRSAEHFPPRLSRPCIAMPAVCSAIPRSWSRAMVARSRSTPTPIAACMAPRGVRVGMRSGRSCRAQRHVKPASPGSCASQGGVAWQAWWTATRKWP